MSKAQRTITARYRTTCAGCGGAIKKGETITGSRGAWYHGSGGGQGCAPSGNSRADQEYWQGRRDVDNYHFDRMVGGEDYAMQEEYNRQLRDPSGW